ncbi:MAG: class I SAM-dependent methyltransferase [Myxococcales bacterium]|nr:class I SAM-dependent methyltransferase [Myxococcales bacterium]
MIEAVDYFSNHSLKLRFPWRLYHGPIIGAAKEAIEEQVEPRVLNYGSGPFRELPLLPRAARYTACDIDARAIGEARERYGAGLAGADVVPASGPLPYAEGSFDLVLSMDVVEHLAEPLRHLREAARVLRPGGRLLLTTPNYGSSSLRLLERTLLEGIARLQGFSRRRLHPGKLRAGELRGLLTEAGLEELLIRELSFGWVLAASGTKGERRR